MNKLMCHLVAGYPDEKLSRTAAEAIIAGGAAYLEVQFPFSDPTADGPLIQEACTHALEAGFTVEKGFRFLSDLTSGAARNVPVFLMTYASLAVRRGVKDFLLKAQKAGVRGVIVPDLPFDSDEGLFSLSAELGLAAVPVLVPGMKKERIAAVLGLEPEFIYVALRSGITGSKTQLGRENLGFLESAGSGGAKIFAGFGINSIEQVETLMYHAEAAVVGSHLVGIIKNHAPLGSSELRGAVSRAVSLLAGRG